MNAVRYKHFWYYLLDLHNLKVDFYKYKFNFFIDIINFQVEGKLRTLANPLATRRLENILEKMTLKDQNEHSKEELDEIVVQCSENDDILDFFYN